MIRTMAVFGVLLLCLSPAVSGLKHAFHFVVIFSSWFETFKIKRVAFCFEGLRHDDVRSANAKASPNQRHPLHQQHPWGLRVQADGKLDHRNHRNNKFKIIIYKQITKMFQVTFETTFTFSWFDTRYIPSKEFLDSSADTTTDTTGLATWHNFKISGKRKKVKFTNQELRHHRAWQSWPVLDPRYHHRPGKRSWW